ncbi:Fc receptor-like protein 5, partial [Larimichthys crocea]
FKVYSCVKGNTLSLRMFASLLWVILGLCYCSKESSQSHLGYPQLSGPSEALVKKVADFKCDLQIYPKNISITLEFYNEDKHKKLGEYTFAEDGASFPMVIEHNHDGNLVCVAKAPNINATVSNVHYLKVIEPVKGAVIDVRSGPVEFFEGKTLELSCNHTAGTYVSYKWLLNGQLVSQALQYHNRLLINGTTSKDSGSYICMAFNEFNKTKFFNASSREVVITVKDLVSRPDISFTVLKEDSHNYSAMVTCESAKGTPPVTFSLYNRTELVANMTAKDRNATFKVPLVLGKHMGDLQCRANNGDATEHSKWIPIVVVPVEGPVMMDYDHDIGESYDVVSLTIYCKAAKGSFPRYQWFLNKTLLDDRGSFYSVDHQPPQQSILMLSVGWRSAGTYHCSVSDSFDHTTARRSKRVYLDKHVLNRIPILGGNSRLWMFHSHDSRRLRLLLSWSGVQLEMESMVGAHEAELDLSEYNEDTDVLTAAKDAEFDQTSEASVDEWPQIEEEKKTLEDEPVKEP